LGTDGAHRLLHFPLDELGLGLFVPFPCLLDEPEKLLLALLTLLKLPDGNDCRHRPTRPFDHVLVSFVIYFFKKLAEILACLERIDSFDHLFILRHKLI
jgi:hypothetical protein